MRTAGRWTTRGASASTTRSITLLSAAVALAIGRVEAVGLLADKLSPTGPVRDALDTFGEHFGVVGYGIVALFLVGWIASILCHRWPRAADTTVRQA